MSELIPDNGNQQLEAGSTLPIELDGRQADELTGIFNQFEEYAQPYNASDKADHRRIVEFESSSDAAHAQISGLVGPEVGVSDVSLVVEPVDETGHASRYVFTVANNQPDGSGTAAVYTYDQANRTLQRQVSEVDPPAVDAGQYRQLVRERKNLMVDDEFLAGHIDTLLDDLVLPTDIAESRAKVTALKAQIESYTRRLNRDAREETAPVEEEPSISEDEPPAEDEPSLADLHYATREYDELYGQYLTDVLEMARSGRSADTRFEGLMVPLMAQITLRARSQELRNAIIDLDANAWKTAEQSAPTPSDVAMDADRELARLRAVLDAVTPRR
jgi:hypothetical protein